MSKALLGTHTTPRTMQLLDEIRALRARVAELESALAEAEHAHQERTEVIVALEEAEPINA